MSNPVIKVDDVTWMANGLDSRAKAANKVNSVVHQYDEELPNGERVRKVAMVKNFGCSCEVQDLAKAVDMIKRIINHAYAYDPDQVKGFLGNPISKVDLAVHGLKQRCAVVTYIALDDEAALVLQEDFDGTCFKEGDTLIDVGEI